MSKYDKPLTPAMQDIMLWLGDGQWVEQGRLYKLLGKAQNVGVTLAAMQRRGLLESRSERTGEYRWDRLWRKLTNEAERDEYQRKTTIRKLVRQVQSHAHEKERPAREAQHLLNYFKLLTSGQPQQMNPRPLPQASHRPVPQPTHSGSTTIH